VCILSVNGILPRLGVHGCLREVHKGEAPRIHPAEATHRPCRHAVWLERKIRSDRSISGYTAPICRNIRRLNAAAQVVESRRARCGPTYPLHPKAARQPDNVRRQFLEPLPSDFLQSTQHSESVTVKSSTLSKNH
jgi:hypothetical protein